MKDKIKNLKWWHWAIIVFVFIVFIGVVMEEETEEVEDEESREQIETDAEEGELEGEAGESEEEDLSEEDKSSDEDERAEEQKQKEKEIRLYADEMHSLLNEWAEYLFTFSDLNIEASENVELIYDKTWIIEMATVITMINDVMNRVEQVEVPEGLESSHDLIMQSIDLMRFVTENYPTAIDNLDADLINQSTQKLIEASELLENYQIRVDQDMKELGIEAGF